jgi:hypothetical protein
MKNRLFYLIAASIRTLDGSIAEAISGHAGGSGLFTLLLPSSDTSTAPA